MLEPRAGARGALMLTLAALAACAQTPPAAPTADGCRAIASAVEQEQARHDSAEAQRLGAWKAVVPFVVAARYADAKADLKDADARLQALQAKAREQGCESHGR